MTVLTFDFRPRRASWTKKLASLCRSLLDTIDAFAAHRAQQAVSQSELRRADREIDRYRRLMEGDLARQVGHSLARTSATQFRRLAQ
jgi:hypothetical protein